METKRDQINGLTQESIEAYSENGSEYAPASGGSGLDDLDAAILRHLERHGRATNYEVGEAVGAVGVGSVAPHPGA